MPLATFEKLLPVFPKTRLAFLQGWGEPFMNPDFFAMASIAKSAGCWVGTTTNGMLLDDEKVSRLVELGIDVVGFSLAGVDERNDEVRKGTRIEKVMDVILALRKIKKELNTTKPAIHIAYMLFRSRLNDLEKLPDSLQRLGVNQVVITTLDYVPTPELEHEAIVPQNRVQYNEIRSRLDAVVTSGKRKGLDIYYQLGFPDERRLICSENVLRALFVSADGDVSPCTFTNIPASEASHIVKGEKRPFKRLTFGKLNSQPLPTIWRNKAYKSFRNSFFTKQPADPCRDCPKLYIT
jgi:MoaA/NifB/PqqE/SkfB family radical SAM enzyme